MLSDYKVGDRVELHPATDTWMRGDRYGEIVRIGTKNIYVRMDKSNRILGFTPDNIQGKVY